MVSVTPYWSNQSAVLVLLIKIVSSLSSRSGSIESCLMVEETALDINKVVILQGCFTVIGWASFSIVKVVNLYLGNCCLGYSVAMACSAILGGISG